MKRKNIIIVFLILITIIVIGVILYFHAQNYSLLDIDASNYSSKLKEIEASVEESEINNCIPDKINIFRSNLSEFDGLQRGMDSPYNLKLEIDCRKVLAR